MGTFIRNIFLNLAFLLGVSASAFGAERCPVDYNMYRTASGARSSISFENGERIGCFGLRTLAKGDGTLWPAELRVRVPIDGCGLLTGTLTGKLKAFVPPFADLESVSGDSQVVLLGPSHDCPPAPWVTLSSTETGDYIAILLNFWLTGALSDLYLLILDALESVRIGGIFVPVDAMRREGFALAYVFKKDGTLVSKAIEKDGDGDLVYKPSLESIALEFGIIDQHQSNPK